MVIKTFDRQSDNSSDDESSPVIEENGLIVDEDSTFKEKAQSEEVSFGAKRSGIGSIVAT